MFLVFSSLKAQNDIFVRIYDTNSRKIAKGFLAAGSDSNIYVFKSRDTYPVPVSRIGYIKTKRTFVRRVAVTTLGIGIVSILYLVSLGNRPFIPLDLPKKDPRRKRIRTDARLKKKLVINGDPAAWKTVMVIFDQAGYIQR